MAKIKKKKGPIRTEALIPLVVVLALLTLYFKFFFDSHLRQGIEYGATYAHGAEVNIGSLATNFLAPSIAISNIQITDKSDPAFNIVRIGSIQLKLLWDGLLRGKVVIPESSILQVQTHSKRQRPGRIIPDKTPSDQKSKVRLGAEKTITQLEEKNEANLLGDIFSIAGGTNYKDQLKKLENEIESQKKIKLLETQLKQKEQEWKKRIDDLPDESEIKQLVKKIETLKIDTSNSTKLKQSLKEADAIYQEARQKYKNIKSAESALKQDFKKYENEYKGLEQAIQDDINGISQKLNIPSLDPKEINKMLLGNIVAAQLGNLMKYKDMAREYMPTKSAKERKEEKAAMQLTPRERANGINFNFPKKKSYPRFWLQKAQISSDSKKGDAGDITGTLKNLTNNPRHLGIPTTLDFTGGFPHESILDVKGHITIDHTKENPIEKGSLRVGSFPVQKNTLSKSKDLQIGYNKADGQSTIAFLMQNETLELSSTSTFTNIDYFANAHDKNVQRMVDGVINSLKDLNLQIRAKGNWDNLKLNIRSNLGEKIASAIKNQVSSEISRAKKQIEEHIRGLVDTEKNKINNELAKIEQQYGVSLKNKESAVASVEEAIKKKKNEAVEKEKKKAEDKLKKEASKLLKGLKF